MPNYTVQADVVDIAGDRPRSTDSIWVDTNVWYWQTYSRASMRTNSPQSWQLRVYPRYLQNCVIAGSQLHWVGLSLSELAHQIEKAEHEIAEISRSVPRGTRPKDFRHDYPALRTGVVTEIQNVCADISSIATLLPLSLNQTLVDQAISDLQNCALDGYDQLTAHALREAGISQVLSDDGDFCTVSGITLFTANRGVIQAARAQGRLITR
ncbi:hypothetical protein [Haloferula sp.]|uniref:hypothetical protein n=1 Tax=Haloferula sp. TaxID=2497595 RepID=UPI003C784C09